jgi:hypothetical protein
MDLPWKQHSFRHIPDRIRVKVEKLSGDEIIVACVKKVSASQIKDYAHLGLSVVDGKLVFESPVMPSPDVGLYSRRNLEGQEIVHRDLPMIDETYTSTRPNYGDWTKGSHDIHWTRKIYQRTFIPPYDLDLTAEVLHEESGEEPTFVIKFSVGRILDRKGKGFAEELLFALNLLQENTGASDVFPADAKAADYLKTVYVAWDILPPGQRDATIAAILSKMNSPRGNAREKVIARYTLLSKLRPIGWVVGGSGFRRYFGAVFGDNLVVFENLDYGNAVYAMFENWQELSKRSRLELLSGSRNGFERIAHREHWETRLAELVANRRDKGKAA